MPHAVVTGEGASSRCHGGVRRSAATATITFNTKRELVAAIRDRYRASSVLEKRRILDEFVVLTGYHRKHAIRVFRSSGEPRVPSDRHLRSRVYNEAVQEAIGVPWASDRIRGKRLKALLPVMVPALENMAISDSSQFSESSFSPSAHRRSTGW